MSIIRKIIHIGYKYIVKPLLFRKDPEWVHDRAIKIGSFLGAHSITKKGTSILFHVAHPSLEQTLGGIMFPNPIGLSAGFDKDGHLLGIVSSLGFGFVQVGTVTNEPYGGNPQPRVIRLPRSQGLVINYGLKNDGVDMIVNRIKQHNPSIPFGISIGYTNKKENAMSKCAIEDMRLCLEKMIESQVGNWYTLNISCPNLFGGEPFTTPDRLRALLSTLYALPIDKSVFLKMPINLSWDEFEQLLEIAKQFGINGVIIGNLNKDRTDSCIKEKIAPEIKGSISGKPTEHLANKLISQTYKYYKDDFIIIGVGGIFSAEDAYEKIKRGASLVQLITGMIFEGPQLIGDINANLITLLKKDGYKSITQAVGTYDVN